MTSSFLSSPLLALGPSFAASRTLAVFLLEIKGSTGTYTTLDSNDFEGCYTREAMAFGCELREGERFVSWFGISITLSFFPFSGLDRNRMIDDGPRQ